MALIKCDECGKEISDKASICVHCGNPMKETSVQNSNNNIHEPLATSDTSNGNTNETIGHSDKPTIDDNKNKGSWGGCLGCLGMIFLAAVVLNFCGQSNESYDPTNPRHVNPVLEKNWYEE